MSSNTQSLHLPLRIVACRGKAPAVAEQGTPIHHHSLHTAVPVGAVLYVRGGVVGGLGGMIIIIETFISTIYIHDIQIFYNSLTKN